MFVHAPAFDVVSIKRNIDPKPARVGTLRNTAAHYEPRDVRGYRLVLARPDGKLGPVLNRSKLDCPEPGPTQREDPRPQELNEAIRSGSTVTRETERLLMSRCRLTVRVGNTTYGGGVTMSGLMTALRVGGVRERIEDHTGLDGLYAFKLTFLRQTLSPQTTDTGDAPSIFTAIQEQLGLKLEPATIRSRAVVIDRLERPTPD